MAQGGGASLLSWPWPYPLSGWALGSHAPLQLQEQASLWGVWQLKRTPTAQLGLSEAVHARAGHRQDQGLANWRYPRVLLRPRS